MTLCAGYAIGYVNDVEDYNSTTLTSYLFADAVSKGLNPFWTDLLGLGMPQPFRISLIQHPLEWLFAVMRPLDAVKALVLLHGAAGTWMFYQLGLRLAMTRIAAATCAVSFAFCSSSVQYLFYDDHVSGFLSLAFYPFLVYLLVLLSETQDPRRARAIGAALGLAAGLFMATGLASHALTVFLVLAVFTFWPSDLAKRHAGPLALAAAVGALIASGVVWLLLSEMLRFSQDAARAEHPVPNLLQHLASALSLSYWSFKPSEFVRAVLADNHRNVAFGPIAMLAACWALFLPLGKIALRAKAAFLAAIVFLALPPAVYLEIISGTWVFRDGVNLFGLLLFGLVVSRYAADRRLWVRYAVVAACAAQIAFLTAAALPPWYRVAQNGLKPDLRPNNLSKLVEDGVFFGQLKRIAGGDLGRVLVSNQISDNRRTGVSLWQNGLVVNTGAFHGVSVVNAYVRGIATSSLHPDLFLMEGKVDATDANIRSKPFLDVLGIRYVTAWSDEIVANGLLRAGTIDLGGPHSIAVWRNPDAWPAAVEVDPEAQVQTLRLDPACGHDRFLCSDFAPAASMFRGRPVEVERQAGNIRFKPAPATGDRLYLVNSWYRPEWKAEDPRVQVVSLFGQLIGVKVPAEVMEVRLSYQPRLLLFLYAVSWATMLLSLLYVVLSLERSARARAS